MYPIDLWLTYDDEEKCYGWVLFQNNDQYKTITTDFYVHLWMDEVEGDGRNLGHVLVTEDLSPTEEYIAGPIDLDGWSWGEGCHCIFAVLDCENDVVETNESNNVISKCFNNPVWVPFYFSSYDSSESPELWASNPGYMTNGFSSSYTSTTMTGDVELLTGNTCMGSETGNISNVWIRTKGYYSSNKYTITLTPVFAGIDDGSDYEFDDITTSATWSQWFEITDDARAPDPWTWNDIDILDCDVKSENAMNGPFTLYCSQVEILVCYTD